MRKCMVEDLARLNDADLTNAQKRKVGEAFVNANECMRKIILGSMEGKRSVTDDLVKMRHKMLDSDVAVKEHGFKPPKRERKHVVIW